MSALRVCVPGAQFSLWRSNEFLFLFIWSRGLYFWEEPKINSRCFWRCVLSWQVLSQQREMRIYGWLCSNSEIHFWQWKVWSLVVCSQSSFHVARARKDDKKTVKSAKVASTFWIFFLKTKNRQFCCLAVTVHIVLQERRIVTMKKTLSIFEEASPPITTKHIRTWTKKG